MKRSRSGKTTQGKRNREISIMMDARAAALRARVEELAKNTNSQASERGGMSGESEAMPMLLSSTEMGSSLKYGLLLQKQLQEAIALQKQTSHIVMQLQAENQLLRSALNRYLPEKVEGGLEEGEPHFINLGNGVPRTASCASTASTVGALDCFATPLVPLSQAQCLPTLIESRPGSDDGLVANSSSPDTTITQAPACRLASDGGSTAEEARDQEALLACLLDSPTMDNVLRNSGSTPNLSQLASQLDNSKSDPFPDLSKGCIVPQWTRRTHLSTGSLMM